MTEDITTNNTTSELTSAPGCSTAGCLLWFLGGITLSFTAALSLVLMALLAASVALNVYLSWELAELEVVISRRASPEIPIIVVTATPEAVAQLPPAQAQPVTPPDQAAVPVSPPDALILPSPTPVSRGVEVESQMATVAAIATQQAAEVGQESAFAPPQATSVAVPINPPDSAPADTTQGAPAISANDDQTSPPTMPPPTATATPLPPTATPPPPAAEPPVRSSDDGASAAEAEPAAEEPEISAAESSGEAYQSNNSYDLIPIEGKREDRPAAEHGDLNLKLRAPQSLDVDLKLVDIDNAGSDPAAPDFQEALKPEFVNAYAIHNWDWGKNDKSDLVDDGKAILVGVKTTPGEPVYIPHKDQDIFKGKYYATVLYADEDSLTFTYRRAGNVIKGYTVHYLGLQVDPNLVKTFRESKGNMLPGLTLDTPVGRAADELIVAIRDNGTFLDMRSRKDWWE